MGKSHLKDRLHSTLIDVLKSDGTWNETLKRELPHSWENYNGFVLFSSPAFESTIWKDTGPTIWEAVCLCLNAHSIAIKGKIQNDSFRSPRARLVYGNSPIVNYLDNRVKYSWNVEKNMFSAGNVTERHRIASYDCANEVIVDLFAGIGYFTLPYLVHAKAEFVHACEWNTNAVEALKRNLKLNKVEDRCQIYEGDNRKVCPKNVANRVNLGLIPSSESYWKVACKALIKDGGILYVHSNVTSQITTKNVCDVCNGLLGTLGFVKDKNVILPSVTFSGNEKIEHQYGSFTLRWKHFEWFEYSVHISHVLLGYFYELYSVPFSITIEDVFMVKSYAPHIDHLVYTVKCKPAR